MKPLFAASSSFKSSALAVGFSILKAESFFSERLEHPLTVRLDTTIGSVFADIRGFDVGFDSIGYPIPSHRIASHGKSSSAPLTGLPFPTDSHTPGSSKTYAFLRDA